MGRNLSVTFMICFRDMILELEVESVSDMECGDDSDFSEDDETSQEEEEEGKKEYFTNVNIQDRTTLKEAEKTTIPNITAERIIFKFGVLCGNKVY